MGTADGGVGDVVDLAELVAVCTAVVECYDRALGGDAAVPPGLDRALAGARDPTGMHGPVELAMDLVGRGATGKTPAELAVAIDTLRRVSGASERATEIPRL
jgi:hypothetical protein